jgi:phenylalanyl-tRNA synthetase beta chain
MRVPLGWLAEWIELPAPEVLAEALTRAGLEVEAIERGGPDLSGFRVGEVLERAPHPNADRLSLCRVDVGGGERLAIVCGAPNVAAGQKVAVALPGTLLADGRRLERSCIRGVESQGMICAPDELGLGAERAGILVLDPAAPAGAPLSEWVAAGEVALEVAVLPNRGDCLSLLGMAREVRALLGGSVRLPETAPVETGPPAAEALRVEIEAPEACHRYVGRVVRGLRPGASPAWLRRRLESAGLRSLGVVVDVTNLVLLELGQPLHAFDLAKLRGGVVRVRRAAAGETLHTLDEELRTLTPRDLLIADAERALALAGIVGGAGSGVDAGTRDVLIESAHFHPAWIRHTARRLGLFTEASVRFERGVDPEGVRRAADRAARLLVELAGGEVARGVVEAVGRPAERVGELVLAPARVNRLLGSALSAGEIAGALGRVGVGCRPDGDGLRCELPSHRADLALPEDLIEEVARIHGYDRIPATPLRAPLAAGRRPASFALAERVRDALEAEGLVELLCLPFVDPRDLDRLALAGDDPRRELVRVLNPIVEHESHLRSTLLPSLLRVARENRSRQVERVAVFELARVFRRAKAEELPEESEALALLLLEGEPRGPWQPAARVPLFFELKGMLERCLARLQRPGTIRPAPRVAYLHPGSTGEIAVGDVTLGAVGGLHPDVAAAFGIDAPCVVAELDLDRLGRLPERAARYREVSAYPSIRRDLAWLVDRERPAGEVLEAIRRQAGEELVAVELFDRYEGAGVPEGRVSLAFRLVFQRGDRTLTDAEVSRRVERVVRWLAQRFGATLRERTDGPGSPGREA